MYILWKALITICSSCSLKGLQRFASALGIVAWYVLPTRRHTAKVNARVIGAENPDRVAKESFKHTFMSYLETAHILNVNQAFVEKYVTIENRHYYDDLLASGQKFVIISAHIGSWDLLPPVTAEKVDLKALIVGRQTNSEALNRIINDLRNYSPRIIYVPQYGYVDKVNEYQPQGYIPASLLDHVGTNSDSIDAPFFGYNVATLSGMAILSARKRMSILPAYLLRTDTGFHLVMHEPIYPNFELKPKACIHDLLVRMNQEFERTIRAYPEQWYLLHRRFKRIKDANGKTIGSLY